MGVLNVTPDSFSDGGNYLEPEAAIAHARQLVSEGALIIDVGGESTRPGAEQISVAEEQRRVLPIVEALVAEGITVSIDTVRAETARLAVAAGAQMINDVSGGTADPEMRIVAANAATKGVDYVIAHWRGVPDPAHSRSHYSDVTIEVRDRLRELADAAIQAGVPAHRLILDPGLGFDKTAEQGWQLLANIEQITGLGYRVLVGASRKRMLSETMQLAFGEEQGAAVSLADRDLATAAVSALAQASGVWGVRVHAVRATAIALVMAQAQLAATRPPAAVKEVAGGVRDLITVTGLEVFAHHGVFAFEREQGQRFVIDAEVTVDLHAAAKNDELASTVHYGELADALVAAAETDPVDLIETLAERLAAVALGFGGVREARITVHKPDAPIDQQFQDVSVTIVRGGETA